MMRQMSDLPANPSTPPCAELHLHIEGTLEPDLVFALAERNGVELPDPDVGVLRSRYAFTDLQSFLDLYYENMAVLRTEADFAQMTRAYLARARGAGVRHAEIMFDPQAHLARGVPLATSVGGIASVLRTSEAEFGISTGLIAAFLRDRPAEEALEVLEDLLAMDAPIIGIGLDSAEVGNPPSGFTAVYDRARRAGLHLVAHAGEEGPPSYITGALDDLGVERIDHGIRCLDDPALVDRLVAEQIPLTVCPLSNVRLRAVPSLAEHPLRRLLGAGVMVTISSDDPAYFGGYVDDNLHAVREVHKLTDDELATLAVNSFRASFLDDERCDALVAEVEHWRTSA
jgi:adenosine deaminase